MNKNAEIALQFLLEGNRRFAGFRSLHPHQDENRLNECTGGQKPVAAVVTCSDSRVPPEVIFDCGIGDIFIIRTAGTVLDYAAVGSIEYAVDHLNVPLILILGHTSCGAVTAAMRMGADAHEGALGTLLETIKKACAAVHETEINEIVKHYTKIVANDVQTNEPVIKRAVENGLTVVVPACYSLENGIVEVLN